MILGLLGGVAIGGLLFGWADVDYPFRFVAAFGVIGTFIGTASGLKSSPDPVCVVWSRRANYAAIIAVVTGFVFGAIFLRDLLWPKFTKLPVGMIWFAYGSTIYFAVTGAVGIVIALGMRYRRNITHENDTASHDLRSNSP